MDIQKLIQQIKPHIKFDSEASAQRFLDGYDVSDQMALISALYIGRDHIHAQELREDFLKYAKTGELNRTWEEKTVPPKDYATVLYEKGLNLNTYYDAFLRCMTNSNINLSNF